MKIWILLMLISCSVFGKEFYTDGIVKKDLGLNPEQLVREYVKRDANGEFLQTNEWWNSAVACPECMGGPDTFTVISSYKIRKISNLQFEVTYDIEGTLSGASFKTEKRKDPESFTVVKTQWGFKLDKKSFQMVRADVALKKYGGTLDKTSLGAVKSIKVTVGPE